MTASAGAHEARAQDPGTERDQAEREEKTLGVVAGAIAIGAPAAIVVVMRSAAGRAAAGARQRRGPLERAGAALRRDVVMASRELARGAPAPTSSAR